MVWICSWILHGLEYLYCVNIVIVYCHVVLLLYVIITQLYRGGTLPSVIVNPSLAGHPFMTLVCDLIFVFIF